MEIVRPQDNQFDCAQVESRTDAIRLVMGAGIGLATSFGPVMVYSFGTFLLPIVQDTGWPRVVIAAAIAPAALIAGLLQPAAGWIVDHVSARASAATAFLLSMLGLLCLALLPRTSSAFVVCMVLYGVLGALQSVTTYTYFITSRFQTRRGLALGVVNTFAAASTMTLPLVATYAIALLGWRQAYVAVALAIGALNLLSVLIFIPGESRSPERHLQSSPWVDVLKRLCSDPKFLPMSVAFFLLTAAIQGLVVNLVPLLMDRGYAAKDAAQTMAVYGVTMLFARLLLGALLDHLSPRMITVVGCLGPLLACVLLLVTPSPVGVLIAAAFLGVGAGAETDVLPYVTARLFGTDELGQKIGIFFVVFACGGAAGMFLFPTIQNRFGSYENALHASVVLLVCAVAVFALMRSVEFSQCGENANDTTK